jgi:hypothetical protein
MQIPGIKIVIILLLVLIFFVPESHCQRNISPMAQKAINLFENHRFDEAQNQFRLLNEKFPKDVLYQFYLGACIVEVNGPLSEAIELLKPAALKLNQVASLYYLGLAYYRQFRFDDAHKIFSDIKKNFRRNECKEYDIDIMLQRIESSRNFFLLVQGINVLDKISTRNDSVYTHLEKDDIIVVKKAFINNDTVDIVLLVSDNLVAGQYYYFSMQGKSISDKDLYRARFDLDSSWSVPEPLSNLNSLKNDEFPFFDYCSQALYFASERESSAGGYDIFMVNFDTIRNVFKNTVHLPFPINSPWNDYLWINAESTSYFTSNREAGFGKTDIYKTESIENFDKQKEITAQNIETKCFLKKQQSRPVEVSALDLPVEIRVPVIYDTTEKKDVPDIVNAALRAQLKADSVMLLVQKIKDKLVNTDDKDARNSLFSSLRKQEKAAGQLQKGADKLYEKLIQVDSVKYVNNNQIKNTDSIYDFLVSKTSPYTLAKPFNTITTLPDGIIYRIQLGAFSKPVNYDFFGGLQPISAEYLQDGKIIKYYVGIFNRFTSADSALIKVRVSGFKEAFIIGYLNNQKIPVERAKDLEINN